MKTTIVAAAIVAVCMASVLSQAAAAHVRASHDAPSQPLQPLQPLEPLLGHGGNTDKCCNKTSKATCNNNYATCKAQPNVGMGCACLNDLAWCLFDIGCPQLDWTGYKSDCAQSGCSLFGYTCGPNTGTKPPKCPLGDSSDVVPASQPSEPAVTAPTAQREDSADTPAPLQPLQPLLGHHGGNTDKCCNKTSKATCNDNYSTCMAQPNRGMGCPCLSDLAWCLFDIGCPQLDWTGYKADCAQGGCSNAGYTCGPNTGTKPPKCPLGDMDSNTPSLRGARA